MTSTTAILIGSTGLVGRHILDLLARDQNIAHIHTISRRAPTTATSSKIHSIVSTNTSTWPSSLSQLTPKPQIIISALGTTHGAAGSVAAQRLIDYNLQLAPIRAAQESGVETCVLISSTGSSSTSRIPYSKMKGELEDVVKTLGFKTTIILRPGLIIGGRKDRSVGQWIAGNVANGLGTLGEGLRDGWAQDAGVIARAAVECGMVAVREEAERSVWVLEQADVVKYGKGKMEGSS